MTTYFKELSWNFPFPSLHNKIKEIAANQVAKTVPIGSWTIIPHTLLINEQPFAKIENAANQYGFSIIRAIYRKQQRKTFSMIHTDSFNTGEIVAVPFSLNIPLENTPSAITRWYDFSNHPTLKDENTNFELINFKKFNSNAPKDRNEFLKYCIADYTMNGPVVINTSIPHNVDGRALTSNRAILSIWFEHTSTRRLATWDQSKFLENITID